MKLREVLSAAILAAFFVAVAMLGGLAPAPAQQALSLIPVSTVPNTGTIANTSAFQLVSGLGYSTNRKGGYIQNAGTGFQYVYLAGSATNCSGATQAKSITLQPPNATSLTQGGSVAFVNGLTVTIDTVCITGTGTDTFAYAAQ